MSEEHLSLSQGIKRCGISTAQTMLFLLILISGTSSSFSCADCPAWRPPHIVDQVLDPWQIRDHLHKKKFLLGIVRKKGVWGPSLNCLVLNVFLFYFFTKVEQARLISVSTTAPAVVYSFKASVLLSIENEILMPLLANFGYFVVNLLTFWCTFSDLYNAVVYQSWQILGMWTTWHLLYFYTNENGFCVVACFKE